LIYNDLFLTNPIHNTWHNHKPTCIMNDTEHAAIILYPNNPIQKRVYLNDLYVYQKLSVFDFGQI